MPADIANGIRYPEPEPYTAAAGRAMQLREMFKQGRLQDQHIASNQMQLDAAKRATEGQAKLSELLYQHTKDGKTDYDAVYSGLTGAGYGDRALALDRERRAEAKAELDNRKQQLENATKQHGIISNALTAVTTAKPEEKQAVHTQARNQLIAQGLIKPEDMPEVFDPAAHAAAVAEGIDADKQLSAANDAVKRAQEALEYQDKRPGVLADSKVKQDVATQYDIFGMPKKDKMTLDATAARDKNTAAYQQGQLGVAQGQLNVARDRNNIERQKVAAMGTAPGGLNDDDFKRLGVQYAITGVMSSLGNGSGIVKQRITHEAQEYARQAGLSPRDLALAQASYKGDMASLKDLQTKRDQIVSFENTAQKNIDTFLQLAAKIPDTGIPWLNTPVRLIDRKLAGSENMAAVDAARTVANNEIAKVTSGGGLGGVLSDNARHEIEAFNGKDLTFGQVKKVVEILKRDMSSRHAAMDEMLGEIKARTANPTGAPAPANNTSRGGHTPGGISVTDPAGGVHTFPDQASADNFKRLAGIK